MVRPSGFQRVSARRCIAHGCDWIAASRQRWAGSTRTDQEIRRQEQCEKFLHLNLETIPNVFERQLLEVATNRIGGTILPSATAVQI